MRSFVLLLGLVTAAVALVIDQASKYWILHDVLEDKAMIIFYAFLFAGARLEYGGQLFNV